MSTVAIAVCILCLLVVVADALYVRYGKGGKEYLRNSKQSGVDWRFFLTLILVCAIGSLIASGRYALAAVVVPFAAISGALLTKHRHGKG